jgi:hypothetical protein
MRLRTGGSISRLQQRALQPAGNLPADQVADDQDDHRGQQFRAESQREIDDGGADLLDGFDGRSHWCLPDCRSMNRNISDPPTSR